jgi:hypothetical protein
MAMVLNLLVNQAMNVRQLRYDLKTVYINFPSTLDSNMDLVKSQAHGVYRRLIGKNRSIIEIKVW